RGRADADAEGQVRALQGAHAVRRLPHACGVHDRGRARVPRLPARRLGARPKTSWVAERTRGCSAFVTRDRRAAAGEASAAYTVRAGWRSLQALRLHDGPRRPSYCGASGRGAVAKQEGLGRRGFHVRRAAFASRGTAVARVGGGTL